MTAYAVSVLSLLVAAAGSAQPGRTLPPKLASLVPQGMKVTSQSYTGAPTMVIADFAAERSIGPGRTVNFHLDLKIFDNSSPLWRMKEPAYRRQMDERIARDRKGLTPESVSAVMFTADPVKETNHGFWTALTQRVQNHPPRAKEYVDYVCAYYGMIGGVLLELRASGVPDNPGEADQWAQSVAAAVSKLTVTNVGER